MSRRARRTPRGKRQSLGHFFCSSPLHGFSPLRPAPPWRLCLVAPWPSQLSDVCEEAMSLGRCLVACLLTFRLLLVLTSYSYSSRTLVVPLNRTEVRGRGTLSYSAHRTCTPRRADRHLGSDSKIPAATRVVAASRRSFSLKSHDIIFRASRADE